jgi:hypothetical protein
MTTAIDTNVLVAFWKTDDALNTLAKSALDAALGRGRLVIAAPVFAELLAGAVETQSGRTEILKIRVAPFLGAFFVGGNVSNRALSGLGHAGELRKRKERGHDVSCPCGKKHASKDAPLHGMNRWESDQDSATINYDGLASAVALLHEEKIGARNLASFAHAAHG